MNAFTAKLSLKHLSFELNKWKAVLHALLISIVYTTECIVKIGIIQVTGLCLRGAHAHWCSFSVYLIDYFWFLAGLQMMMNYLSLNNASFASYSTIIEHAY